MPYIVYVYRMETYKLVSTLQMLAIMYVQIQHLTYKREIDAQLYILSIEELICYLNC